MPHKCVHIFLGRIAESLLFPPLFMQVPKAPSSLLSPLFPHVIVVVVVFPPPGGGGGGTEATSIHHHPPLLHVAKHAPPPLVFCVHRLPSSLPPFHERRRVKIGYRQSFVGLPFPSSPREEERESRGRSPLLSASGDGIRRATSAAAAAANRATGGRCCCSPSSADAATDFIRRASAALLSPSRRRRQRR